jgi:hypothetical protein
MRCANYLSWKRPLSVASRHLSPAGGGKKPCGTVTPCPPWGMALTAGERKGGFHINQNDDLSSVPKNGGWPVISWYLAMVLYICLTPLQHLKYSVSSSIKVSQTASLHATSNPNYSWIQLFVIDSMVNNNWLPPCFYKAGRMSVALLFYVYRLISNKLCLYVRM